MHHFRFWLAVLASAFLLGACGSRAPVGPLQSASGPTSEVRVVDRSDLPPPVSDVDLTLNPYRIGPLDVLEISVFGIEELGRREVRVDGNGRISFPLAGTIDAAGLTPGELEAQIARRLRAQYIRDPQVSVNLKEVVSQTFTVAGSVVQPGIYPVAGQMTLIRAVAAAKGMDEFAKTNEVIVFREVGGERFAGLYDLRGIQRGHYDDPRIFPDDVIVVGNSPQRRLIRDAIGIVPALLAPLIITLTQNN